MGVPWRGRGCTAVIEKSWKGCGVGCMAARQAGPSELTAREDHVPSTLFLAYEQWGAGQLRLWGAARYTSGAVIQQFCPIRSPCRVMDAEEFCVSAVGNCWESSMAVRSCSWC